MYNDTDKQMAGIAFQFMQRTTLQGSEVNQFSAACNWLLTVASPDKVNPLSQQIDNGQSKQVVNADGSIGEPITQ